MTSVAWGAAWLETLALGGLFDGAALSRARGVAARGGVVDVTVEPSTVVGSVVGRAAVDHRVRLGVRRLTPDHWVSVRRVLGGSGRWVAAVLNGELPSGLVESLTAAGCGLMPTAQDVSWDCTCNGSGESCSHAAAVCCWLALALDDDPLLLITLRGGDRSVVLGDLFQAASAVGRAPERMPGGSSGRSSAIPGRPDDPTMAGAAAWRRRPAALPEPTERRRAPGRPRLGTQSPAAEFGFDQSGLGRLIRDAMARAEATLEGEHWPLASEDGSVVADAVRRCAGGSLLPSAVAQALDVSTETVHALVDAWQFGPPALDVLVRPGRLSPADVTEVEAVVGVAVRTRSTGALLADGRQVRRASDGTWVLVAPDPALGWKVEAVARSVAELVDP